MDTITTDVRTLNGDVKKILELYCQEVSSWPPQTQRILEHIALLDANDLTARVPSCSARRHAGRSCKAREMRRRCMPCVRYLRQAM